MKGTLPTMNTKQKTVNLTIGVDRKAKVAFTVWSEKKARIDKLDGDRIDFTVLGYSYTIGSRRGNYGNNRCYSPVEKFSGRILSKQINHAGRTKMEIALD